MTDNGGRKMTVNFPYDRIEHESGVITLIQSYLDASRRDLTQALYYAELHPSHAGVTDIKEAREAIDRAHAQAEKLMDEWRGRYDEHHRNRTS